VPISEADLGAPGEESAAIAGSSHAGPITAEEVEHVAGRPGWLLLVPVLALLLVAPPALGAYHAARIGTVPLGTVPLGTVPPGAVPSGVVSPGVGATTGT